MKLWNELSLAEKGDIMKVAVRNGIKTLPEIRQAYNEFAEGGDVKQDDYYSIMEKVAEENYKNWGFNTPDEALVHALNDNTYNYKGYYKKYPQSQANADTHWTDEFKTVYHPTFSTESIYSGKKSEYNPLGLPGGMWVGETFIPSVWQTVESNKFAGGSYMEQAKSLIRKNEGWSAKPYKDAPTGRTWRSVGYGFNDSGFRDKYPEGISKHYKHGITKAQAEEELNHYLGKAERTLRGIYGKQWNTFTDGQKAAILDTYYQRPASVGKGSAFYKAVRSGKDATNYLGVNGYEKRNKGRREAFSGTREIPITMQNMDAVMSSPIPVQESIDFIPLNPQVFGMQMPSYQIPTVTPEQPIVEAAQQQVPTPEQLERERVLQERQDRRDRLDKFNLLMSLSSPQQDNGMLGAVGMLAGSQFGRGGAYL
jgi:GH24 family phage-related lysozyme (muramidase)